MGDNTVLSHWAMSFWYGTAHLSLISNCTVLSHWAMPSLYETACLSCVDYGWLLWAIGPCQLCTGLPIYCVTHWWLHCFKPLGHAIFVWDCTFIMCWLWVITMGHWAMSSLNRTAHLSCVDHGWLHCFRLLGHVIFVDTLCVDHGWLHCFGLLGDVIFVWDCPFIMCWLWVITIGRRAMSFFDGTARLLLF